MKRDEILDAARQAVMVDRAATHGEMEDTFTVIASYWSTHLDHDVFPRDVAAMLALLKLARARTNHRHADNWVDLAGYAACGGELDHD